LPDLSGYGNHGELINGPTWLPSNKQALSFAGGVNDALQATIEESYFKTYSNPFTFSAWIKARSWRTNGFSILSIGTVDYQSIVFSIWTTKIALFADTSGNATGGWEIFPIGTTTLLTEKWYHLCVIRNLSGTYNLYVNGFNEASLTDTNNIFIANSTLRIGAHYGGNTSYDSDGFIDDVRIYKRVLSQSEIGLLASERGIGLKPERLRNRYSAPITTNTRNRSSRFLGFPA
jgi:hypothetical protein